VAMLNSMSVAATILPAPASEPARHVGAAAPQPWAAAADGPTDAMLLPMHGPRTHDRRASVAHALLALEGGIAQPLSSSWRLPCCRRESNLDEPTACGTSPQGRADDDDMSEGSDEVQADDGIGTGAVDDDMKALLDGVLHQLLPAAIERMLPAGSAVEQLPADACQASSILPAMRIAP